MSESLSTHAILNRIADAALFGSLGLFAGTGLSKDLTLGETPSFLEVLERVVAALGLDYSVKDPENAGVSFPGIAERIVLAHKEKSGLPLEVAEIEIKKAVCLQCNLLPDLARSAAYRKVLEGFGLQWVVTTNYDYLVESVIPNSQTIDPRRIMNVRFDYVPIFHIHGHLYSPEEIVLTESDYVQLFSPIDYRQLKLNLLLAESTTIMIGYSLGDINVKHAMEWQRTLREKYGLEPLTYQSMVIQVLYKEDSPALEPYLGPNGESIIETNDVLEFLSVAAMRISGRKKALEDSTRVMDEWLQGKQAQQVAESTSARSAFISNLVNHPRSYNIQDVVRFLDIVLDPIWGKAREDGGWEQYSKFLIILVEVLAAFPSGEMHPTLLINLAERLENVFRFVDSEGKEKYGTSYSASIFWGKNKDRIPIETRAALRDYAVANFKIELMTFFGSPN